MAETTLDVRGMGKREAYAQLEAQIDALLDGMDDEIAAMATISCVLHNGFGHLWTGFYRVVSPGLLRVGPYQGTLGCLDLEFGRGVCGPSAAERRTIIVADVERFPGHITCDPRSKSEIVVPVFDRQLGQSRYLVGDSMTAADLFLAPMMFSFQAVPGLKELGEASPNLGRWMGDMSARPSMKATEPEPIPAVAA